MTIIVAIFSKDEKLPNHFTVLASGSLYAEHVLSEDTAGYTCTGVNVNGEASSTVHVDVERE